MHSVIAAFTFPLWLRVSHYLNILFIGLVIRAGIQIAGAHPRLYWNDGCNPDSAWLKLTRKNVPVDKLYTSMDDEAPVSPLVALPGKDNLGLGRHWHFFSVIFWLLNGLVFLVLLFVSGEWSTLIPTSWSIVPRAWHTLLTYLSFHVPPTSEFRPYDPLQQLSYAGVIFLLAPFMLLTGAAMSPSIGGRFPWYLKLFGGKQGARSLHFLSLLAFLLFIMIHTAMVLIVHFQDNVDHIVLGRTGGDFWVALAIWVSGILLAFALFAWASWYSLRHRRQMQHALGALVDPVRTVLLHRAKPKQHYKQPDISPYFWINGRPPETEEYIRLAENNFTAWKLEVCGLVEHPLHLSLDDLRTFPRQTQITKHHCIQGWSGVAEWGGVSLTDILKACGALPEARYLVFTSYQLGKQSVKPELQEAQEQVYYEVIDMLLAQHPETILAYEMNSKPLPVEHGAPLRLRVETVLGYKMVKYLRSIELVEEYNSVGLGQGGFREDFQFYGRGAEI